MLIPCRATAFGRHGAADCLSASRRQQLPKQRIDDRLDQIALQFERSLVSHQPRADVADVLDRNRAVGLRRAAGETRSAITSEQPDQRRQLHQAYSLIRSMCTPLEAK